MKGAIRGGKARCIWRLAQEFVVWEPLPDVPFFTELSARHTVPGD